jgi:hypothetical protein
MEGLEVLAVTPEEAGDLPMPVDSSRLEGRQVFVVRAPSIVGYVVAGAVFWHEDNGEYYDPSHFFLIPGNDPAP